MIWPFAQKDTFGKLALQLTPSNPKAGQIAICRSVTEDQWRAILAILNGQTGAATSQGGDGE